MADDDHQPIARRHEPFDPVHRQIEMLRIEASEALVEEEGVEAAALAGDDLGQGQRQGEGGEERLPAAERGRTAHRIRRRSIDQQEFARLVEAIAATGEDVQVLRGEVPQGTAPFVQDEFQEPGRRKIGVEGAEQLPRAEKRRLVLRQPLQVGDPFLEQLHLGLDRRPLGAGGTDDLDDVVTSTQPRRLQEVGQGGLGGLTRTLRPGTITLGRLLATDLTQGHRCCGELTGGLPGIDGDVEPSGGDGDLGPDRGEVAACPDGLRLDLGQYRARLLLRCRRRGSLPLGGLEAIAQLRQHLGGIPWAEPLSHLAGEARRLRS